ncbi:hypothetical protein [Nocardioides sp. SYSU DS0663]|uniref:hypothetical protein n=1 Tax=Nocardioides sp. SYSU DS0663 TaxID=3416445 RepID=UPI003F4B8AC6
MSAFHRPRLTASLTGVAFALSTAALTALPAEAASRDRDGDGMPNRWEAKHGLDPHRADARGDLDKDGLANRVEHRRSTAPDDEDTDDDGHDDGDEVKDGLKSTDPKDSDTDDDGVEDGDEDADQDGIDNEDEDDPKENCLKDDDDADGDDVSDEDENDFGYRVGDDDTDDDGLEDGEEDHDRDGEADEDEDDDDRDKCAEVDEDVDDLLGIIASYDSTTGNLVVHTRAVGELSFVVTSETEIEVEGSDEDGSTADLEPGMNVLEAEVAEHEDDECEQEWEYDDGEWVHESEGDCDSAGGPLVLEEIELQRP